MERVDGWGLRHKPMFKSRKEWRQRFAKIGIGSNVLKDIWLSLSISLAARSVGLVKEAVVAGLFGVSAFVDLYVLAMIMATFFVGPVVSSICTPLTFRVRTLYQSGEIDIQKLVVTATLSVCLLIMLVIVGVLAAMSPWFIKFQNSGLLGKFTGFNLDRYLLVVGLFSAFTVIADAVLAAQSRFVTQTSIKFCVPSLIIISCLLAPEHLLLHALFIGTIAGYAVETILASICIRDSLTMPGVRRFSNIAESFAPLLRQWPPMVASSIVISGCVIVDQTMAILAGEGAVAMISFGNRLTLGLLSLASVLWTVLYPQFIDQVNNRRFRQLRQSLVWINVYVISLGLLCCATLAFMSEWITALFYQRGAFTPENTDIVSRIQIFYFLHIPFYIAILINARIVNAFEKTGLYFCCNLILLIINILLNLFFVEIFGVVGIALATLLSYSFTYVIWFGVAFLLVRNKCR